MAYLIPALAQRLRLATGSRCARAGVGTASSIDATSAKKVNGASLGDRTRRLVLTMVSSSSPGFANCVALRRVGFDTVAGLSSAKRVDKY